MRIDVRPAPKHPGEALPIAENQRARIGEEGSAPDNLSAKEAAFAPM